MIKGIVAVSNDWGIGKNNGLLFNLSKDMQHFRETTKQAIVVCGENTLKSFPNVKPLKGRSTIVLCPEGHDYDDCICVHTFKELVNMVKVLAITNDVYIIGGGMMYNSMLPYYDEVIVTKVDAVDPETTVFFPNLDQLTEFQITSMGDLIEDNGYKIRFLVYRRV